MTEQSPTDQFAASGFLDGANADYIDQLQARYAADPAAVDAQWAAFFKSLGESETINEAPRQYLNRLSDLMFVLSRVLNRMVIDGKAGDDVYWKSERMARESSAGEAQ